MCLDLWFYNQRLKRLTSLFSLTAPSNDAPVYREQKSNIPSNTGLENRNHTSHYPQLKNKMRPIIRICTKNSQYLHLKFKSNTYLKKWHRSRYLHLKNNTCQLSHYLYLKNNTSHYSYLKNSTCHNKSINSLDSWYSDSLLRVSLNIVVNERQISVALYNFTRSWSVCLKCFWTLNLNSKNYD